MTLEMVDSLPLGMVDSLQYVGHKIFSNFRMHNSLGFQTIGWLMKTQHSHQVGHTSNVNIWSLVAGFSSER